jgi:hypothetical protein
MPLKIESLRRNGLKDCKKWQANLKTKGVTQANEHVSIMQHEKN